MANTATIEAPKQTKATLKDQSTFERHYEESVKFLESRGWVLQAMNEDGESLWLDPGPGLPKGTRYLVQTEDRRTDNPDFGSEKEARDWAEVKNRQIVKIDTVMPILLPDKDGNPYTQYQPISPGLCWTMSMKAALALERGRDEGKKDLERRAKVAAEYRERAAREKAEKRK